MFTGWVEALRGLGEQVQTFNMNNRLTFFDSLLQDTGHEDADGRPQVRKALTREQAITVASSGMLATAYQWWPDVVLAISAFFTPPMLLDIMRDRGHKVVLVHSESPYQDGEQLERAAHADLNLINDPVNLGAYQALGPALYMPHAYRPALHHPGPPDPRLVCDLAFTGTGYPSRIAFFEAMNLDGLDVVLAGNWSELGPDSPLRKYLAHEADRCLDNEQTAALYRSARAGLNIYREESEPDRAGTGWACGPREIEMAACGLFFARQPRGEGDELLPMLPTFDGPGDASEQLRWWLAHDKAREKAATQARAAVASRTFDAGARRLLQAVDELVQDRAVAMNPASSSHR
jgi:hypothetical protein